MPKKKPKPKKRVTVERPFNAGTMTASEKHSMIISALRKLSQWWKPITRTKAAARIKPGIYKCEKCGKEGKEYSPAPPGKQRRIKNFAVDHFKPSVGADGFTSYDDWIERTFIEQGKGLWLLCKSCHDKKSKLENEERKKNKAQKKTELT